MASLLGTQTSQAKHKRSTNVRTMAAKIMYWLMLARILVDWTPELCKWPLKCSLCFFLKIRESTVSPGQKIEISLSALKYSPLTMVLTDFTKNSVFAGISTSKTVMFVTSCKFKTRKKSLSLSPFSTTDKMKSSTINEVEVVLAVSKLLSIYSWSTSPGNCLGKLTITVLWSSLSSITPSYVTKRDLSKMVKLN
jgi:hypothetical protein